jgi:propionyl-CoA carboxylase alpha chain
VVTLGGQRFTVALEEDVLVDGEVVDLGVSYTPGERLVEANADGVDYGIRIEPNRTGLKMTTHGKIHTAQVLPARIAHLTQHMIEKVPPDLSRFLICPMPGLLVALHVAEGDTVEAGQPLAVVEAMKMENILRAEKSATVKKINAQQGESLAVDAVILELE